MGETKWKEPLIAFVSSYSLPWSKSEWDNWNSTCPQPYLELYGETHPIICTNIMETLPTHSMDGDPQIPITVPIYEYYWTVGISDHLHKRFVKDATNIIHTAKDQLQQHNDGAKVTLYFPLTGGWRAEEVVATIKYVRPLPHHEDLTKKVAAYWETVAPAIAKVSELIEHLSIPAVSTGATLLNTLAKVPITSLPPVDGLSWDVKSVTGLVDSEIMEGIQWTLPKKLFYVLGNRVTGSIAVYFHPAHRPNNEAELGLQPPSHRRILAKAEAYDGDQPFPIFGKEAIELKIEPYTITDLQKIIA